MLQADSPRRKAPADPQTAKGDRADAPSTTHGIKVAIPADSILLEILQGARSAPEAQKARNPDTQISVRPDAGRDQAVRSAEAYRTLCFMGYTVRKIPDLIIATYCIEHHLKLLQNDRDFRPMVEHLGLKLF